MSLLRRHHRRRRRQSSVQMLRWEMTRVCAADLNGQNTVCLKVVSFAFRRFHLSPFAVNLD